jgi:hypothetical protein
MKTLSAKAKISGILPDALPGEGKTSPAGKPLRIFISPDSSQSLRVLICGSGLPAAGFNFPRVHDGQKHF